MIDITDKITTHRTAIAQATVRVSKAETIEAVQNRTVPKGDVLEASRVAALFAVKRTSDVIPDCHPLPIEYTSVSHHIEGLSIIICTEVHTIYRTGVEVEAMHGASVAALTIYDMLKPIDKDIEIQNIRLLSKKGGKSQFRDEFDRSIDAAVVVCSDSIAGGKKQDSAGKAIISKLEQHNINVIDYTIIPDDVQTIQQKVTALCDLGIRVVIITGGTGLSVKDVTPEAVSPLIERHIPGIMEAARSYGQQRMPYAMLSRGVSGLRGDTLILTLPGSTRGAEESMDALFPGVLHLFKVTDWGKSDTSWPTHTS